MSMLRPSRLVAATVLPALAVMAVLADRALVRALETARDHAELERSTRARQAGLALRAEIASLESDAVQGRERKGVVAWRLAAPLDGRLSEKPGDLASRSREELIVLASSSEVTPRGLPAAVVAALALGEERVVADVRERLLAGRLPVSPDDLPSLAAALGAADDARLPDLVARLRSVPPLSTLPRLPEFLRVIHGDSLEGWARDRSDIVHWQWSPWAWLATGGASVRGVRLAAQGDSPAVAVDGIAGLELTASLESSGVKRLSRQRALTLAAFLCLAGLVVAASAMLSREERTLARERAFLAGVTHELRTPVTAVRLLGETLSEGRGSPAEYGALIASECERLEQLVERSLLAARTEARPSPAPLVIEDLLARVVSLAEPLARKRGKRVEIEPGVPLPGACWDAEAVRQALSNLVDNALRHGGTQVSVRAREEGGLVHVAVKDDGPGIRRRDRRRIFGRFERGADSASGTGLGLWLAEQVARAHGGRVELETDEGRGCTFTMVLPLRVEGGDTP